MLLYFESDLREKGVYQDFCFGKLFCERFLDVKLNLCEHVFVKALFTQALSTQCVA